MKEEDIHVIQVHVRQVGLINNRKEQLLKASDRNSKHNVGF
jgi:hypothetical protein